MAKSKVRKQKEKEIEEIKRKQFFIKVLIASVIFVLLLTGFFLIRLSQKRATISKYATVINKEEVREKTLSLKTLVTNPRVLTDPLRFADSFTAEDLQNENGKVVAHEAIIIIDNPSYYIDKENIPSNASILLIVDTNLNVLSLTPFNPTYFDLGIEFVKYFESYKQKNAELIIRQVDGINVGSSNTALVIKNKVREALSLLYIEKFGLQKFSSLQGGGYIFAERGVKVNPVSLKDVNGATYSLDEFKNYKLVIIAGNPNCGACVSSVSELGKIFKQQDLSNVKFIVLSFGDTKEALEKLTNVLPEGTIGVIDSNREIATQLKLNISPYIALVDKDLTLYFRGPAEPNKNTLENIKEFLTH